MTQASIESPCILICSIEQNSGYCYGCGRSRDEIAQWASFSPQQRQDLMENELHARVAQLEKRPRRITKRKRMAQPANDKAPLPRNRDIWDISS